MIKSIFVAIVFCASLQANAFLGNDLLIDIDKLQQHAQVQAIGTQRLPWVVGESADYEVKMGPIPGGSMTMEIKSENDRGFWVNQNISILGQQQVVEMLFDKNTGEVLEVIANGEKQDIPDSSDSEIIEQREESITVPAGTYDCVYIKARSEGKDSEAWINPIDVPVFGLLQQIAPSQLGKVVIKLVSFKDL